MTGMKPNDNIPVRHRRDLWRLVTASGLRGNAAEIGVAEGYFSADILSWPCEFPRVYMVDRWACNAGQKGDGGFNQSWHDSNRRQAQGRVAKFGDRAVILQGDSHLMAAHVPNQSLALVYIDGDHSYDGVMRDIQAWFGKLVDGGIMAFHDYEAPEYGVKQAVKEFCNRTRHHIHLLPEDNLADAGAYFYVDPVVIVPSYPIC